MTVEPTTADATDAVPTEPVAVEATDPVLPQPAQPKRRRQRQSKEEKQQNQVRSMVRYHVGQAANGNKESAKWIKIYLSNFPWLIDETMSLAGEVEAAWTSQAASGNPLQAARYQKDIAALRAELLGPAPTPMERVLVEHLVMAHVAYQDAEHRASYMPPTYKEGDFRIKRVNAAQKRLTAAVKALELVRGKIAAGIQPDPMFGAANEPVDGRSGADAVNPLGA